MIAELPKNFNDLNRVAAISTCDDRLRVVQGNWADRLVLLQGFSTRVQITTLKRVSTTSHLYAASSWL